MNARLLAALIGVLVGRLRETSGDVTEPAGDITRPEGATVPEAGEPTETVLPEATGSPHRGRIPGWPASRAHAPVISQRFTAARDQVRPARNFVAEVLGGDHPLRDDAVLLTSELATNAIEHSAAPTEAVCAEAARDDPYRPDLDGAGERSREFVVTVAFTPHGVLITVQDSGTLGVPCTRDSGPAATGGRGLVLVNELATRWGFHRDATGTVIWFELGSSGAEAGRPGVPVRWTWPYGHD